MAPPAVEVKPAAAAGGGSAQRDAIEASVPENRTGDQRHVSTAIHEPTPGYDALARTWLRLYRLGHLQSMVSWDQAANMPPKGNEARAQALAEIAMLTHGIRTDPGLKPVLARAQAESLSPDQRANLREIERDWFRANALPAELVERHALVTARCEHAWRTQRKNNDWAGFAANLKDVLEVAREEARHLAQQSGLSLYDALINRFEPGMRSETLDRIFGDVKAWLPGLIAKIARKQADEPTLVPVGPFDRAAQRQLCEQVMRVLKFDFDGGRLDVSSHPFSGGVPEDVRLTTRFRDDEFVQSLMGTIHETGHGRYEQNLPRELLGQPVAEARSMGIHESQSLAFEMQIGCHPGFVAQIAPMVRAAFGDQPALETPNLQRVLTRVQPSFIRVDADEVTYPAHVILRYGIERGLIEGLYEVDDIPALWDEKMMSLLGVGHPWRNFRRRRPDAGRALAIRTVRLLPLLHARRDVCGAVVRGDASRHARSRRRHLRRQSRADLRLAAREHLAAGQSLDDRRTRDPGLGRDALEIRHALQGAPGTPRYLG